MYDTVAIIGAGLIGGSIGKALLQRNLAHRVVGIGRRESSLKRARNAGAVTDTTTRIAWGVKRAEVVVVCTPVECIADHVLEAATGCHTGTLITDGGSIKQPIIDAVAAAKHPRLAAPARHGDVAFVGSHPLAGSEKTGPQHAHGDLFEGRTCIVTPTRQTSPDRLEQTVSFWRAMGAQVDTMTPNRHDAVVAQISHLPHAVVAALAAATSPANVDFAGTGWLDTTRVASGDVELWRQILSGNRQHVLKALDKFGKVLSSLRDALEQEDDQAVQRILQDGKDRRDAVGS